MIPKSGGEFPILLEAFGPLPAYLFAWTSATVLKPSSLAILSLTFAKYALSAFYPGTYYLHRPNDYYSMLLRKLSNLRKSRVIL